MTMTMVNQPGTTAPTTCTSVETSEGTYTCVGNQEECVAGFGSGGAISPAEMSDIVNCCCQPTAPSVQQCYAQITAGQDCPSGSKILTLEECKQAAGSSETEWVGGARLWDHTSDGYPTGILDGYPTGGIGCYSNSVTTYYSANAAGHANAGHTALCTTPCAFSYPSLSLFRIATRGPVSLPCPNSSNTAASHHRGYVEAPATLLAPCVYLPPLPSPCSPQAPPPPPPLQPPWVRGSALFSVLAP